jgi:hypothetical protein
MKRLFGGATLLFAAFPANAGLISADFRAGYERDGGIFLSNGSDLDSGEVRAGLDPMTKTLALQAQDHVDFQAGPNVTGITFLTEPPAADATPIPEPATLAFFGLGAGTLCLARQGKSKRA